MSSPANKANICADRVTILRVNCIVSISHFLLFVRKESPDYSGLRHKVHLKQAFPHCSWRTYLISFMYPTFHAPPSRPRRENRHHQHPEINFFHIAAQATRIHLQKITCGDM